MSISRNILANTLGGGWIAINGIIFVPFYVRVLGPESFGLIGVFTSLLALLAMLDMGLSPVMNREMSRLAALNEPENQVNTARTIELIYCLLALLVGAVVALMAKPIAWHWLNPKGLDRTEVQHSIEIMALVIAIRWPIAMYSGGLNGLQKQVQVNIVGSVMSTVQGGGALIAISVWTPSIVTFFLWQAFSCLVHLVALRWMFWNSLKTQGKSPRFDPTVIRSIWRFAAGMSGIALSGTLLTQLDKLILSRVLSLDSFGYYTFATTVASLVLRFIAPVFIAYYPRLTQLVTQQSTKELGQEYLLSSQVVAAMVFPVSGLLIIFSYEILLLWTSDAGISKNSAELVAVLSLGNALNALMNMPYALQLAHAQTRLAMQINLASLVLMVPALYFASINWGGIGAAWLWVLLNIFYLTIGIHLMHRLFLPEQKRRWYVIAILGPGLGAVAGIIIGYPLVKLAASTFETLSMLAITGFLATAGTVLGARDLRKIMQRYMKMI